MREDMEGPKLLKIASFRFRPFVGCPFEFELRYIPDDQSLSEEEMIYEAKRQWEKFGYISGEYGYEETDVIVMHEAPG